MSIPLNIPRDQEYAYRQAEKLIKERYGFYTSKYPGQSENMQAMFTGQFGGGASPSRSENTGRISFLSWKSSL